MDPNPRRPTRGVTMVSAMKQIPSEEMINISADLQGVPRVKVTTSRRVFLMLNYTDITQNTYIQSWTVTEIMVREVWNFDSCYTLNDYQIHIETGMNMWFL